MSDYIGLLFTGIVTIIFVLKSPWDKNIFKTKIKLGHIGIAFYIIGTILTGRSLYLSILKQNEYETLLRNINNTTQKTYSTTTNGFEIIGEDMNKFSNSLKELTTSITSDNDSILYSKFKQLEIDYEIINKNLKREIDFSYRCYYADNWPVSDSNQHFNDVLFDFIPMNIAGLITGTDRYIIWYLIKHDGTINQNQKGDLFKEISNYVKPTTLSINFCLKRLELCGVIKPNFWLNKIEFTSKYKKRLDIYNRYFGSDEYRKRLDDLYFRENEKSRKD